MQDTRLLTLESRGAWIDLLCLMWRSPERGKVSATPDEYARLFGCKIDQAQRVIKELASLNVCDAVTNGNENVTLICRRMVREEKERQMGRARVEKFRKRKSNAECNENVTVPSSVSVSVSVSDSKKKEKNIYGSLFQKVRLTEEERQKLTDKFGDKAQEKIDALDEYIASKGKKYSSHYATILSWERKEQKTGGFL